MSPFKLTDYGCTACTRVFRTERGALRHLTIAHDGAAMHEPLKGESFGRCPQRGTIKRGLRRNTSEPCSGCEFVTARIGAVYL